MITKLDDNSEVPYGLRNTHIEAFLIIVKYSYGDTNMVMLRP